MSNMTRFERNFEIAMDNHKKASKKPLTILEGINLFFDGILDEPVLLEEYVPVKGKKNAIVLLGQSCTGKSTYAKEFLKNHPEFKFLSLDECAAKELMSTNVIFCFDNDVLNNTLGFREFGKALENGENLLIDGGWLHINSRSALLKTLRQLGYNTCAFSFLNITQEAYDQRVKMRATQYAAQSLLNGAITMEPIDWIGKFANAQKLPRDRAIKWIQTMEIFRQKYTEEVLGIQEEFESSALRFQVETGFLYVAFNSVYMVNPMP